MSSFLSSLRLGPKIGLSIGLFVLPVALILILLAANQNKDIEFATKEVAGTRALAVLSAVQAEADVALLSGTAANAGGGLDAPAFAQLGLARETSALGQSLSDAHDAASLTAARTALRDLQSKVGDRSNLILDNVLDTYYLTDVVLNRLPELLDRLADIGHLAAAQGTSVDARADFLIALGGLSAVLDGMDVSLHAAVDDEPGGGWKRTLLPDYEALHTDLADLSARLQKSADASGDAALLGRTAGFTKLATLELERALDQRVSHLTTIQRLAFIATFLLFGLAAAGTMLVIRAGVIRPVNALCLATRRLANGDLDNQVPQRRSRDEVAELARDIAEFRQRLIDKRELEADQAHADSLRSERYLAMGELARDFNTSISSQLAELSSALEQLRGTAEIAASRAEGTSRDAADINERTGMADRNTQTVAAATEQLAASAGEIAAAVGRSTEASRQMQRQAEQAAAVMTELTTVTQGMAGVIELINSIAGQTNLLALNATIEAARAGEAGKGFAVVASEVKALAGQTARATEDIGRQVGAVQGSAEQAADLMRLIAGQVTRVEDSAGAIAAAVDEQGSATQEISRNVQQAALCIREVADRMDGLGRDAGATRESSAEMLAAFRRMAGQAAELHHEVDSFLLSIGQAADRRTYERHAADDAVEIAASDGRVRRGRAVDFGAGGFAMRCDSLLPIGDAVRVDGLAERPLQARVVASGDGVLRLHFRYDPDTLAAVEAALKRRFPVAEARAA
nr:methyl-accepting chemotaxis protein [uncultured Rhodopila sp.]